MFFEFNYTGEGVDIILMPRDYIPGSVKIEGGVYTVTEIPDSLFIMVNPEIPLGDKIKVIYESKESNTNENNTSISNSVIVNLIKTVKEQQKTIERIEKLLSQRVTYQHLTTIDKSLSSRNSLIEQYIEK